MIEIKRVMEKDAKGVDRQIYPITHVSAVDGLDEIMEGSASKVLSVNGKTGAVVITKEDLGISSNENLPIADEDTAGAITAEMFNKLSSLIADYEQGKLGGSAISFEPIENEGDDD